MGAWNALFAVTIEHQYFGERDCSCLHFESTPQSQRIMDNIGLLMRHTSNGIQILQDGFQYDAQLAQADEGFDLIFKVYAEDENYRSYSRPFDESAGNTILYFDNSRTGAQGVLSVENLVSVRDLRQIDAALLNDVLRGQERRLPPLFVLKISVNGNETLQQWLQPGLSRYQIRFASREVFWKYYLFGCMADENLYIHDPDGKVEFESLGKVEFPGAHQPIAFRTKERIPRREYYSYRFQLMRRSAGGDRDKLIMSPLPVAGIRQLGQEVIGGSNVVVSEIFINS